MAPSAPKMSLSQSPDPITGHHIAAGLLELDSMVMVLGVPQFLLPTKVIRQSFEVFLKAPQYPTKPEIIVTSLLFSFLFKAIVPAIT